MSDFTQDWNRERRSGFPEAVFCASKSAAQIDAIIGSARDRSQKLLLTRLEPAILDGLNPQTRSVLDYDPLSRTAILGESAAQQKGGVALVTAGTSDLPVAHEALRTLAFAGHEATIFADVGVAGLWRLIERLDEIRGFRIVIAFAGMEGALFSVLAGLISAPLIAVPTSVGYGVGSGGETALGSALASCAPGVVAVNIDNGFGAAVAAIKICNTFDRTAFDADLAPRERMGGDETA